MNAREWNLRERHGDHTKQSIETLSSKERRIHKPMLIEDKSEFDETRRVWIHKGKLREQAAARKWKRLGGILVGLLLGIVVYFLLVR